MGENETSLIYMTIENLNKKFEQVLETMTELKVSINNTNANTIRQMDVINAMEKEIGIIRGEHNSSGCLPLKNAVNVRDEQVKHLNIEIEKQTRMIERLLLDLEAMKIKIALWSGGISVLVWGLSFFFKGLWK